MNYRNYVFSAKEWVMCILAYLFLDGCTSFLFYRSWIAFIIFLPGVSVFAKKMREKKRKKRLRLLSDQFLMGMQALSNALSAGYSIENAFEEALEEMKKVYGKDSLVVLEFTKITTQLSFNQPLEGLLENLAERSEQEDILNFAQIFRAARKSGGDLISIIKNTVSVMGQKEETRKEIEICIAARKMEQNVMSLMPYFILLYVGLSSPEFITPLYGNVLGVVVMTICLAVYLAAWEIGRRIVDIEV